MTNWVALLRGVNVGGITIRNAELTEVFAGLGYDAVKTYLASGNVRFETDASPSLRATVARDIERALRERFAYDAWIVLITVAELARAIDGFAFDDADPQRQPWVVFGSNQAVLDELVDAAASFDRGVDPIATAPGVIYWNPVKGTTVDTPFGKLLARKAFASTTTNRNLRTLRKIAG
jgi:uncharacterized protein (DUF1697 family)